MHDTMKLDTKEYISDSSSYINFKNSPISSPVLEVQKVVTFAGGDDEEGAEEEFLSC